AITRAPQTNSNLLFYSYPQDGQDNVAPQAPIVLAFGRKIPASASHFHVTDENGDPVAFSLAMVNHGRGVVLTPNQPLSVKSHYQVTTSGLHTDHGELRFPDGAIDFTTRPALKGAVQQREASSAFVIHSIFP